MTMTTLRLPIGHRTTNQPFGALSFIPADNTRYRT